MCVAGHDHVEVRFGFIHNGTLQRLDVLAQHGNLREQVQPDVRRHLVVAAAACVQLARRLADQLAQTALDGGVDVLIGGQNGEGSGVELGLDRFEAVHNRRHFVRREDAHALQRARVGDAAGDVRRVQPPIEADRGVEALQKRVGRLVETSAPEFAHPIFSPYGVEWKRRIRCLR